MNFLKEMFGDVRWECGDELWDGTVANTLQGALMDSREIGWTDPVMGTL